MYIINRSVAAYPDPAEDLKQVDPWGASWAPLKSVFLALVSGLGFRV